MKYLTKTLWERNASNGLETHATLDDAADCIGENAAAGAVSIRLFELTELEYETITRTTLITKPKEDADG